jgi:conjugative relaxase-like TrwC/TraI family protein
MIRMIPSGSAGHAKAYFADALSKADYYLNDQELQGRFHGRLAERLGLTGPATKDVFYALCENKDPRTQNTLTQRVKEKRITGYDINFHCPKSVSILHALSKDDHILAAFEKSVQETMLDIEADSKTRVRKGKTYDDRKTGELIWSDFTHQTARPVEGKAPDPHLHSHCFVFNATFDREENKIKAAKFRDIMRNMPFYQARFHKRLADRLAEHGYRIKPTKSAFEIEGVPQAVIDHFSKRTDQIGRVAKEKGITNAKQRDALGAKTRSKKQKGLGMAELKTIWRDDISKLSLALGNEENLRPVRHAPQKSQERIEPQYCVDQAIKHCFERASVVNEKQLLAASFRFALGETHITVDDITRQFKDDRRIFRIKQGGMTLCTTKEVLLEEKLMVELARDGRGKMAPLYHVPPLFDVSLSDQQKDAITHLMTTTNRVCIVRGAAGTGKTRMMRQAVNAYHDSGKKVIVVAPTAQASRGVLKEEGFKNAETVAKLLTDKKLQTELHNQVLWVDEAGLLGTKDMLDLLRLAEQKNARLILGGDTRQHSAVTRGDALRILNTIGGIKAAELSRVQRQKTIEYRAVVEDLSKGDIAKGFEKLDRMGSIVEIDPLNPHEKLVDSYIATIKQKKSALIICPTHKEGDAVTDKLREKLREAKLIGKREVITKRLANLNLTEAERADWRSYEQGLKIQFNQNRKGIKRGSLWTVKAVKGNNIHIADEKDNQIILPRSEARNFEVFKQLEIGLSKGDQIRITRNGFDKNKKRLNNGMTLEVAAIGLLGGITLVNKASKTRFTLPHDYGHVAHAHCITSHSSQGKTVDQVFIAQPSATFGATDAKQFYVSVSRGRESVSIYTDDKEALLEHASEFGNRQSALELVSSHDGHQKQVERLARVNEKQPTTQKTMDKSPSHSKKTERDYEPGI